MKLDKTKIFLKVATGYLQATILSIALIFAGLATTLSAIFNLEGIDRDANFIGGPICLFFGLLIFWRIIWRNYKKEYFAQLWSKKKERKE